MLWAEFVTRQFLKYRNSCDSQYYEPYNLRNDRGKLRFKLTCDVLRAMLLTKPIPTSIPIMITPGHYVVMT